MAPLRRERRRAAARILSRAFIDYPGFLSIGPRHAGARRFLIRRYFESEMAIARRFGGQVMAAQDGGDPVGVAIVFEPGRHEPPAWSVAYHASFVLFGPGVVARGIRVLADMSKAHPDEPHLFLNALGVDPGRQRGGAGRALVGWLVERSEQLGVPAFLHTTRPENLPYYRGFGFEVVGERPLPRSGRFWSMLRELSAPAR